LRPHTNSFPCTIKINHQTFFLDLSEFICNDIFLFDKKYEYNTLKTWANLCKNSSGVLDVGSHVGIFSFFAALMSSPESTIVAIEPAQKNFEILSKNSNQFKNVTAVKTAVTAEPGDFYLMMSTNSGGGVVSNSIRVDDLKSEKEKPLPISTVSLKQIQDTYFKKNKIDLIKIDVEGCEFDLFLKSNYFEEANIKNIIVELFYSNPEEEKLFNLVFEKLHSLGYSSTCLEDLFILSSIRKNVLQNWLFTKN
jgi:FkbM family methyltransferase